MSSKTEFISKTQHYLKVKKPLLERQRRARINKCLDTLKTIVAEMQGNDDILRMDKAEMLESVLIFMRSECSKQVIKTPMLPAESFRNGYMNAVNEVSRVMAATPGINVEIGKTVMTHLGFEFNRLLHTQSAVIPTTEPLVIETNIRSLSPASSGYHSDSDNSPMVSPQEKSMWRPW